MKAVRNPMLEERIKSDSPKKILSIDGGGVRGVIALEILQGMENMLRNELGKGEDFVLASYFDFIAGTSTGAIIAAAISSGMSIAKIRDFYLGSGKKMFQHASIIERWHFKYRCDALAELLQEVFGLETILGSDRLKTILMMMLRNVNTDQSWAVTNNPRCRYNRIDRPDCQLNLPLWQLIRASTAAPTFFPPETIQIGQHNFVFEDGSISSYTNPAFYAFLRATAVPFDLHWETGDDKLLLVSIGTGLAPHIYSSIAADDLNLGFDARAVPVSMIMSSVVEQDLLCRVFGRCLNGHSLDKEVGDLLNDQGVGNRHLFSYVRYNELLTQDGFARLGIDEINPEDVVPIDAVDFIDEMIIIGRKIAEHQIKPEHFSGFL